MGAERAERGAAVGGPAPDPRSGVPLGIAIAVAGLLSFRGIRGGAWVRPAIVGSAAGLAALGVGLAAIRWARSREVAAMRAELEAKSQSEAASAAYATSEFVERVRSIGDGGEHIRDRHWHEVQRHLHVCRELHEPEIRALARAWAVATQDGYREPFEHAARRADDILYGHSYIADEWPLRGETLYHLKALRDSFRMALETNFGMVLDNNEVGADRAFQAAARRLQALALGPHLNSAEVEVLSIPWNRAFQPSS